MQLRYIVFLMLLTILLPACAGQTDLNAEPNQTIVHAELMPSFERVESGQMPNASNGGIAIFNAFRADAGLIEINQGALYRIKSGTEFARGTISFITSSDFSNTHVLSLLNFQPYPALITGQQVIEEGDFSPEASTRYDIPIRIAADALHTGTNCFVMTIAEDPYKRIHEETQTVLTGLRVDIIKGEVSDDGCASGVLNHPEIEVNIVERTVGTIEPSTSIEADQVRTPYRVAREELPDGRLYTRIANRTPQQEALLLLNNGRLAEYNDQFLVRIINVPEPSKEAVVSIPVPNLSSARAPMGIMGIPYTDDALGGDPLRGQPKGWNQVVIKNPENKGADNRE